MSSIVSDTWTDQRVGRLPRDLYLELLGRALVGLLGREPLRSAAPRMKGDADATEPSTEEQRRTGADWPLEADTMVGLERLDNVRRCVEDVLAQDVPGDLIETGVWRGGTAVFMRGILAAHAVADRCVWVADSFQGLPPPDVATYPADRKSRLHEQPFLAVSEEEVRSTFRRYELLDEQVRFVCGWFRDTLPRLRDERFAVIRLDGDMYESTMVALESLYPQLSVGGYVIVDDFALRPCRQAVEDYRAREGIEEPIVPVDWTGVFWRKERPTG